MVHIHPNTKRKIKAPFFYLYFYIYTHFIKLCYAVKCSFLTIQCDQGNSEHKSFIKFQVPLPIGRKILLIILMNKLTKKVLVMPVLNGGAKISFDMLVSKDVRNSFTRHRFKTETKTIRKGFNLACSMRLVVNEHTSAQSLQGILLEHIASWEGWTKPYFITVISRLPRNLHHDITFPMPSLPPSLKRK